MAFLRTASDAATRYDPVSLSSSYGTVQTHYYRAAPTRAGVIWVGGVSGGFDTPALGLYPRLCGELQDFGVASLRVRYRHPTDLNQCVADVQRGIDFLKNEGAPRIGLVGHSFGGAVVIEAAYREPDARAVVTLATQSYGTDAASALGPRCALLLIHGQQDAVLPPQCSTAVHHVAREPKHLILFRHAAHELDEAAEDIRDHVRTWLVEYLGR